MKNRIFRFITRLFSGLYGKIRFQQLFRTLFYVALDGLHYGKVHDMETDGEIWLLKTIRRDLESVPDNLAIFDVGANEGDYARAVSEIFNDFEFRIHLFEPGESAFRTLKNNLQDDRWILNHFGLGAAHERVHLHVSDSETDSASIYHGLQSSSMEEIELFTLDAYCERNGVEMIHLLKLDVEGHEFACLLGAENMLKEKKIHSIQFEFGKSNVYSRVFFRDIYEYLDTMNYEIFRLVKNGLVPIRKYHPSLEIFLTTNYFAQARHG